MPRQTIIDDYAAQIAWLYLHGELSKKDKSAVLEFAYYICDKKHIAKTMISETAYRVGYAKSTLAKVMSECTYKKKKARLRVKLVSIFNLLDKRRAGKMTVEEAKEELKDIDSFCRAACIACNSEWYCPCYCDMLEKARKLDFDRIIKCYARHDGDMSKVFRYIKETKLNRKKGGY